MKRILLALGVKDFEKALKHRLSGNEYQIVGEAIYRESVVKKIKETAADILIIRESLTGNKDILELITQIRTTFQNVRIIFIASKKRKPGDALLAYIASYGVYDILIGDILIDALIDIIVNPRTLKDASIFMPNAKLSDMDEPVFETKAIVVPEEQIENSKNRKKRKESKLNLTGEHYFSEDILEPDDKFEIEDNDTNNLSMDFDFQDEDEDDDGFSFELEDDDNEDDEFAIVEDDSDDDFEIAMDDEEDDSFDIEEDESNEGYDSFDIDEDDDNDEFDIEENGDDEFEYEEEPEEYEETSEYQEDDDGFDIEEDYDDSEFEVEDETDDDEFNIESDSDEDFDIDDTEILDEPEYEPEQAYEENSEDDEFELTEDEPSDNEDLFDLDDGEDDSLELEDDDFTIDYSDNDSLGYGYEEPEQKPATPVYEPPKPPKRNNSLKNIKTFENTKDKLGDVIIGGGMNEGPLDDTDFKLGINKLKSQPIQPKAQKVEIKPSPISAPSIESDEDKYSRKKSPFGKNFLSRNKNIENATGTAKNGKPSEGRSIHKQKIITFISPKVGVGNSQISFNTALKIASTGAKVLYIETSEDGATLDYLYEFGYEKGLDYILAGINNFSDDTIAKNIMSITELKESFQNNYSNSEKAIGKKAIEYFPDSFNYLMFSNKFREASITKPQKYNADKFLEMLTLLLSQYNYEYIIIDTDFNISSMLLQYILQYSSQIYITLTQDVEIINRYLNNLKPYLDLKVNKNINKHILLNKEEKISLSANDISEWIEEPILASLVYSKKFNESNYQGIPILMVNDKDINEFFDTVARTSITG